MHVRASRIRISEARIHLSSAVCDKQSAYRENCYRDPEVDDSGPTDPTSDEIKEPTKELRTSYKCSKKKPSLSITGDRGIRARNMENVRSTWKRRNDPRNIHHNKTRD